MKWGFKILIVLGVLNIVGFQNCADMSAVKSSNKNTNTDFTNGDSGDNGNDGDSGDTGDNGNGFNITHCNDNGNSIPVGGTKRYYLASQVACGQNCDSTNNYVIKKCEPDGSLSILVGPTNGTPISSFTHNLCTTPSATTCGGPTTCTEHGITAQAGETRRFYLNNTVACGQNCDSSTNFIDKRCEQNGQYTVITNASSPIANYRAATCSPPAPSSCGGSSTQFERPGCVPPNPNGFVASWNALFSRGGRSPWPSFGVRNRTYGSSPILSLSFTATNITNQFGTIATAEYPNDGEHGILVMSISKTPGCIDPAKLPSNCVTPPFWMPYLSWKNGSSQHVCNLTPGETYYFNIFWGTTEPHSSGAHCPAGGVGNGACGRDMQNQIQ